MRNFFSLKRKKVRTEILGDFWGVDKITDDGLIFLSDQSKGFAFDIEGLDGSFFAAEQLTDLHNKWRSALRFSPDEEIQILFRKRVDFSTWIEDQLNRSFLADNAYGRRIVLDKLADHVLQMGQDQPPILSQKIIACFWTKEKLEEKELRDKRLLVKSQLNSFGLGAEFLNRENLLLEVCRSAQELVSSELREPEWPSIKVEAGHLQIHQDNFRALELVRLPESSTDLGMIQAITSLPYPIDLSVRLKAKDVRPIISRLERKRNLLNAQMGNKESLSPQLQSQIEQIDQVLKSLADRSESIFEMQMIVGLRFSKGLANFHRKALADIVRAGAQMNFCELEETTLGTFDSFLECIPTFKGKNIHTHTVLSSNAIHFLPFFRAAKGDDRAVATFHTRNGSFYGIDPVDSKLANYNWLVSGTSGAGKSFFVNSMLAQSLCLNPNIFIVDIGGSYNKLTQFLGGRVMSLEPGQGFQLSPFFLPKSFDPEEERLRRQHIYQAFLEMARVDKRLPDIETRYLLSEALKELFDQETLPQRPITFLVDHLSNLNSREARRLTMLLKPWAGDSFFGQLLDNNKVLDAKDRILTFDLKGLTEFEDLSRVVQLIVCASLWARIRETANQRFSWIVLDEVAFSLLKTQPQFVDELVSTLRKYFAGAIVVVQDFEKVTSSLAGSSILQNTQSKAILQQRGNPKNYSEVLSLNQVDEWAIASLQRERGSFSDIFLIRDDEKTVIRHIPSPLEYWLSTTAPEDNKILERWMNQNKGSFQDRIMDFVSERNRTVS